MNDKLKAALKRAGARFDALSQRERGLVAAAVLGSILFIGNTFLIDPDLTRARSAQRLMLQQQGELAAAEIQLTNVRLRLQEDPDAQAKAKLKALAARLSGIDASLKELEAGLVPPEKMPVLLERLLARHANLRLLSFRSIPPVDLAEQASAPARPADGATRPAGAAPAAGGLYRHGIELRLEGSYADIYAWVSQLESSPQKLLWGDVRFTVVEHPKSVLTVTVFTLSSDKAWLAI